MDGDDRKVVLNAVNQTPARNPEWLVVRCPGTETVDYETELRDQGIKVWTPVMWIRKRLPRRKIKVWAKVAVLPSYLFVRVEDLRVYGGLPWSLRSELIPMSINGRYVVLDDRDLQGLREMDLRTRPEPKGRTAKTLPAPAPEPEEVPQAPTWEPGADVRVMGLLEGAEAVVLGTTAEGEVLVALKYSPAKVKVSGFLLERLALDSNSTGAI